MEEILEFLKGTGKYNQLLSRWLDRQTHDIWFEVLFAFYCETNDLALDYEVSATEESDKTVDFGFSTETGLNVCIELVRPELNEGLRAHIEKGGDLTGYVLSNDDEDPDFRTCAQLIKLQWGLLEKVEKFSEIDNKTINIIVVDCSNVHAGMFDHHDLRMAMYGRPYFPILQEHWEVNKLLGMWENVYSQRGSEYFRDRISMVIFVPDLNENILDGALAAINPLQSHEYRMAMFEVMKAYKAFIDVKVVQ